MRRSKRRTVNKLVGFYNSNDRLRWFDIDCMLYGYMKAYNRLNKHEQELLKKRWSRNIQKASDRLRKMGLNMQQVAIAMQQMLAGKRVVMMSARPAGRTYMHRSMLGLSAKEFEKERRQYFHDRQTLKVIVDERPKIKVMVIGAE